MTEQQLDRALADSLDVEPRPDFLARVRAEVAREPIPTAWASWWRVAAVGSAVAALAAMLTLRPADHAGVSPAAEPQVRSVASTPMAKAESPTEADDVRTTLAPARKVSRVRTVASPRRSPAGGGASAEAGVLRLAIEAAQDGLFPPADASLGPLEIVGIDVPPLTVEPLAAIAPVDAGERQ